MPLASSRGSVASMYATARRSNTGRSDTRRSNPGKPSVNQDPVAPGVRAGSPLKGKANAAVRGRGKKKGFGAGRGSVRS